MVVKDLSKTQTAIIKRWSMEVTATATHPPSPTWWPTWRRPGDTWRLLKLESFQGREIFWRLMSTLTPPPPHRTLQPQKQGVIQSRYHIAHSLPCPFPSGLCQRRGTGAYV